MHRDGLHSQSPKYGDGGGGGGGDNDRLAAMVGMPLRPSQPRFIPNNPADGSTDGHDAGKHVELNPVQMSNKVRAELAYRTRKAHEEWENKSAARPELSDEDTVTGELKLDALSRLRILRVFFATYDKHKHDAEIVALWKTNGGELRPEYVDGQGLQVRPYLEEGAPPGLMGD